VLKGLQDFKGLKGLKDLRVPQVHKEDKVLKE
jgi:hypothetical protein